MVVDVGSGVNFSWFIKYVLTDIRSVSEKPFFLKDVSLAANGMEHGGLDGALRLWPTRAY